MRHSFSLDAFHVICTKMSRVELLMLRFSHHFLLEGLKHGCEIVFRLIHFMAFALKMPTHLKLYENKRSMSVLQNWIVADGNVIYLKSIMQPLQTKSNDKNALFPFDFV